jgi:alanine dehydrogenase
MKIGLPKEIKTQEHRVAITPSAVATLVRQGNKVFVEKNAGGGAGFMDEDYRDAGATLLDSHKAIFEESEMIVKVKEPLPEEYGLLRKDMILFTYLHLAASKSLTEGVQRSGVTSIAYETIQVGRKLPLLQPMSEIAGRMAPLVGGQCLAKHYNGNGVLLSGVPGVAAGKVLVLGGGVSGYNAAKVAAGMGAEVTVIELDGERVRWLDDALPQANIHHSTGGIPDCFLENADLIIGAVLIPGAKAPRLIHREDLKRMKPGSVIVDIAIDQGGCIETSRPTTHEQPTYVEEGIIHYCVANMPGAYARTSTIALTNATFRYVELLAKYGLKGACERNSSIIGGINTHYGKITCKEVAEAHQMMGEWQPMVF